MAVTAATAHEPPSRLKFLSEVPRAAWTLTQLALAWPKLAEVPPGDGRPVLVLPGLLNSDWSNFVMRRFLARIGYRAYGWTLGPNLGARAIGREGERLIARVEAIRDETGEKVTLIGVSLGGIMARVVAQRRPDLVREVITVSAPFAGPPRATNVWRAFELFTGDRVDDAAVLAFGAEGAAPLPVPATAIWSAGDGFVNGLNCRDEACHAIEVQGGHLGVHMNPEVLRAIGGVLGGGQSSRRPEARKPV